MNEVKPVSDLVWTVIGIAMVLGAAGTLYDANRNAEKSAATAMSRDQLSYSEWDKALQHPSRTKARARVMQSD